MMRHGMAAAGLLVGMAGLAVIADPATTAATDHKRFVKITDTACVHDVTGPPVTLKKQQNDRLKWVMTNSCPADTPVLICVYLEGNSTNPFEHCLDDGDIGTPVIVPKTNGHKNVTCKSKSASAETTYQNQVLVGAEIPGDNKCPGHPLTEIHQHDIRTAAAPRSQAVPQPPFFFTHILDFDIAP